MRSVTKRTNHPLLADSGSGRARSRNRLPLPSDTREIASIGRNDRRLAAYELVSFRAERGIPDLFQCRSDEPPTRDRAMLPAVFCSGVAFCRSSASHSDRARWGCVGLRRERSGILRCAQNDTERTAYDLSVMSYDPSVMSRAASAIGTGT